MLTQTPQRKVSGKQFRGTSSSSKPNSPQAFTKLGNFVPPPPPQRTGKTFLMRLDKSMKDIVLTVNDIVRNVAEFAEEVFPNGFHRNVLTCKYALANYDFLEDLKSMTSKEKQHLWEQNYVEIRIGISDLDTANKIITVSDRLDRLGPEFFQYTKNLFISLNFPKTLNHAHGKAELGAVNLDSTPALKHLVALVDKLQGFTSLVQMVITLELPTMPPNSPPMAFEQYIHVLPFFDLMYTDWRVLWKTSSKDRPMGVPYFYIKSLIAEKVKIDEQRKKEEDNFWNTYVIRPSVFVPPP